MVLALVAASVPLAGLVRQLTVPVEAAAVIPVLACAAVGVVIGRHQPGNPVGWLLLGFTLLEMLSIDAGYYAVFCYSHGHPQWWFAPVAVLLVPLWAAAAALFNPVRQRVQQAVDRRFNRARYDADQMVAAFAARLKDAVDLDSVQGDLAGAVSRALEPAHVSVWISRRD